jgi:hypothetical protein
MLTTPAALARSMRPIRKREWLLPAMNDLEV